MIGRATDNSCRTAAPGGPYFMRATTTADAPANATPLSAGVGHYENFPVASWLCPAALRPAVVAIYHFARTADDIADEGPAKAVERLDQLARYRAALQACLEGAPPGDWPDVFVPLGRAVRARSLPAQPLHDLLSAFEQDVRHTAAGHLYADSTELLAYCRLSANPVGRLLLHLYGVDDDVSLAQSDAVCSALQLINFWQDIRVDHARGRHYLPMDGLRRHGLSLADFAPASPADSAPRCQALVAELCGEARTLMGQGAPLACRIPGRAGWELRLVIQGGLCILDKLEALDHRSWLHRPTLGKVDLPRLLWRALRGADLNPPGPAG
jgi:squalene synthase HpnC